MSRYWIGQILPWWCIFWILSVWCIILRLNPLNIHMSSTTNTLPGYYILYTRRRIISTTHIFSISRSHKKSSAEKGRRWERGTLQLRSFFRLTPLLRCKVCSIKPSLFCHATILNYCHCYFRLFVSIIVIHRAHLKKSLTSTNLYASLSFSTFDGG